MAVELLEGKLHLEEHLVEARVVGDVRLAHAQYVRQQGDQLTTTLQCKTKIVFTFAENINKITSAKGHSWLSCRHEFSRTTFMYFS